MFYYISGELAYKNESFAVIDAGGVGYRIYSTSVSLDQLGEVGSRAKLYTYLNIKSASDICMLYGFTTLDELNVFELLIGVRGIGAKAAVNLLSNISPSKFAMCVATATQNIWRNTRPDSVPRALSA